jgi:HK97 family phage portal protein
MNKSFVYVAQSHALKSGAVSMSALDWKTMFGGQDDGELDEHGAYQAVSWVSRCIELRCNALSAIPAKVYKAGKPRGGKAPQEQEWEFAESLADILWMTEGSVQLYGRAYWLREENLVKDKGYRWLAPSTITPKYSATKGLDYFERQLPNRPKETLKPVKDVLYYWHPNLKDEVGPGKGWVSKVLTEAGVAQAMNQFAESFFDRGAIPAVLLSVEGNPKQEELDRLEAWWRRLVQGVKKAFETVAIRASVHPEVIGFPTEQLAMPDLLAAIRSQIAVAAGVPETMIADAANFATAQEHHQAFYEETVVPEAIRIQAWLNRQLFNPISLRLVLDWQALSIFQEDEGERAVALQQLTASGVPLDVAMQMLGMDLPGEMTYNQFRQRLEEDKAKAAERQRQAFAARQPQQTPPGQPPQQQEQREEIRRWRRKALKSLSSGKGAAVDFDSDVLTDEQQQVIAGRLAQAGTDEEVKAAFRGPFRLEAIPYP